MPGQTSSRQAAALDVKHAVQRLLLVFGGASRSAVSGSFTGRIWDGRSWVRGCRGGSASRRRLERTTPQARQGQDQAGLRGGGSPTPVPARAGRGLSAGTFDTCDEAETAWIEQAEALRRGVHVDPRKARTLFRDFAPLWIELFVADRANTARGYDDALRVHLLPTFGHLRLCEITPEVVARWVADLGRRGYQPSSIRTLKGQLSGILATAVVWRSLTVHPCVGVKVPKETRRPGSPARRRSTISVTRMPPGWRVTG